MSDELNNELISDSVADAVESIADDIVMDAIAEAVAEKVEELSAPEPVVEPVVEEAPVVVEPVKEDVITTPSMPGSDNINMVGLVGNGAIGSVTAPRPKKSVAKKSAPVKKAETVAVYSTRNVTWNGVGKVYRGYNIVDKDAAEKWLTRDHVRLATPEEVAKEFGR